VTRRCRGRERDGNRKRSSARFPADRSRRFGLIYRKRVRKDDNEAVQLSLRSFRLASRLVDGSPRFVSNREAERFPPLTVINQKLAHGEKGGRQYRPIRAGSARIFREEAVFREQRTNERKSDSLDGGTRNVANSGANFGSIRPLLTPAAIIGGY